MGSRWSRHTGQILQAIGQPCKPATALARGLVLPGQRKSPHPDQTHAAYSIGGSIGREGRAFMEKLKAEWTATGKPLAEAETWLTERLKNVFVSVDRPPRWVGEE